MMIGDCRVDATGWVNGECYIRFRGDEELVGHGRGMGLGYDTEEARRR